jgi:hypothetical protein
MRIFSDIGYNLHDLYTRSFIEDAWLVESEITDDNMTAVNGQTGYALTVSNKYEFMKSIENTVIGKER